MKKSSIILGLIAMICHAAAAQTLQPAIPPSSQCQNQLSPRIHTMDVPPPTYINPYNGGKNGSNAFAKIVGLDACFPGDIVPDSISSGLLYRLKITSKGACSLGICLEGLQILPGTQIYLHSSDNEYIMGPIPIDEVPANGIFRTPQIPGSEIILEMLVPNSLSQKQFSISKLYYDFTNRTSSNSTLSKYLASDFHSCSINENINGDYGKPYQAIKHSIIRYSYEDDGYLCYCTGVLVNSTNCDTAAYMLTAAHCICDQQQASTIVASFNFETDNSGTDAPIFSSQNLNQAYLVATAPQSPYYDKFGRPSSELYPQLDFTLIRLPKIPKSYKPYFAGIQLSKEDNSLHPYVIHHPSGGQKSISIADGTPYIDDYPEEDYESHYLPLSHWHIEYWQVGTTQHGSSGAPLFNDSNLLIGTLSGGYASCSYPADDYFQRISKAWDYFPAPENQLRYWLAPNCDVSQIEPFDPYNLENPLPKSHLSATCNSDSTKVLLSWSIESQNPLHTSFDSFETQDDLDSYLTSNSSNSLIGNSRWQLSSNNPHSGSNCVELNPSEQYIQAPVMVLPPVEFLGNEHLSFWARAESGASTISVLIRSQFSNYQILKTFEIGEEWSECSIQFNENAVGTYYLAFSRTSFSFSPQPALYVDDIILSDSATLSNTAVCTGYQLYCNNRLIKEFSSPEISEYNCDITRGNSCTFYILNLYGDNAQSGKSNTVTITPGYKPGPSTSAGDLAFQDSPNQISIFPNPARGFVAIQSESEIKDAVADFIDPSGRIAKQVAIKDISAGQELQIPLLGLESGNYIMLIHSVIKIYCHQKLTVIN